MNEVFITLISTLATITIAFFGLIKGGFITIGKKENGVSARLDKIETNDLHAIAETLKRIEDKLGEIHDNILIVKTKINNGK